MKKLKTGLSLLVCLVLWLGGTIACRPVVVDPTPTNPILIPEPTNTLTPVSATVIPPSPEGHPTALPPTPGGAASGQKSQSGVTVKVDPPIIQVGQTITLTGIARNVGMPHFSLNLNDEPAVTITYNNEIRFQGFTGEVVEFVSASGGGRSASFVLRALQPGEVVARISASGEVYLGNGGWSWGGASSEEITLTIQP